MAPVFDGEAAVSNLVHPQESLLQLARLTPHALGAGLVGQQVQFALGPLQLHRDCSRRPANRGHSCARALERAPIRARRRPRREWTQTVARRGSRAYARLLGRLKPLPPPFPPLAPFARSRRPDARLGDLDLPLWREIGHLDERGGHGGERVGIESARTITVEHFKDEAEPFEQRAVDACSECGRDLVHAEHVHTLDVECTEDPLGGERAPLRIHAFKRLFKHRQRDPSV
mmetsp:Transcript_12692/g.27415  ORF Transcript_12692/g.27415 Transcript_12692/m.27415 type:complete len:230 (+) Transcript_12692:1091-1780(+)